MTPPTRVSVVMPVYNRQDYVEEAVDSIIATGYEDLEILIFDDGSTDATPRILADLRARHPTAIRLLSRPGGRRAGYQPSANRAIAEATGEYVCFLDSDDLLLPNRFEVAVPLLDADPSLDGVLEAVEVLFEDEDQRRRWGDRPVRFGARAGGIPPERFLEAWLLDRACTILTPTVLVRSRLFRRSGVYRGNGRLSEDYHLWLRMVACGRFAVGEVERPIARYRRHGGNRWMPGRWDSLRDVDVLADVRRWARRSPDVAARNVAVLDAAYRRKARWCLSALRAHGDRAALGRLAAKMLARDPSWGVDRGFLGNLARGLLGDGTGASPARSG